MRENLFKSIINRLQEKYARLTGRSTKYYRSLGIEIGNNFHSGSRIEWGTEPYLIKIGDNVKITDNVRFVTHDGGLHVLRNLHEELRQADIFGRITIGNNVFVGNSVIILPGVHIGDNVIIGAGAVVSRDIPSNSVAAGVPCKVVSSIDQYYAKKEAYLMPTKGLCYDAKKAQILSNAKLLHEETQL